jgi:hypothetical protein
MAWPRSSSPGDVDLGSAIYVAPPEVTSPDSAMALARAAGARTVLLTRVLPDVDSLRVAADAYDVASGNLVGHGRRSAPPGADPRAVIDGLTRDVAASIAEQPGQTGPTRP